MEKTTDTCGYCGWSPNKEETPVTLKPKTMFCDKCDSKVSGGLTTCPGCGQNISDFTVRRRPDGADVSFEKRVYSAVASVFFIFGAVLYTAGAILTIVLAVAVNINAAIIFSIIASALPLVAIWLMITASIKAKGPSLIFTAFTIFRISVVIGLIAVFIPLIMLVLGSIGFIAIIIVGVMVLYVKFYILPLFNILKCLESGITHDYYYDYEKEGVVPFTIFSFILLGLGMLVGIPGQSFAFVLAVLLTSGGQAVLLLVLREFAKG